MTNGEQPRGPVPGDRDQEEPAAEAREAPGPGRPEHTVQDAYVARRLAQEAAARAEAERRYQDEASSLTGEPVQDSALGFYVVLGVIVAVLLLVVIALSGSRREEAQPVIERPAPARPVPGLRGSIHASPIGARQVPVPPGTARLQAPPAPAPATSGQPQAPGRWPPASTPAGAGSPSPPARSPLPAPPGAAAPGQPPFSPTRSRFPPVPSAPPGATGSPAVPSPNSGSTGSGATPPGQTTPGVAAPSAGASAVTGPAGGRPSGGPPHPFPGAGIPGR